MSRLFIDYSKKESKDNITSIPSTPIKKIPTLGTISVILLPKKNPPEIPFKHLCI